MKAYILSFYVNELGESTPARVYLEKDYDQAKRDFEMIDSQLHHDKVSLDEVELYGEDLEEKNNG